MHNAFHANYLGHTMHHPHANPIFQRHDFQKRRSASEPAHELQIGANTRLANHVLSSTEQATNNQNHSNEPNNHKHGDDCNYVDCLQKITTVKVRCLSSKLQQYTKTHSHTQTHTRNEYTRDNTQYNVTPLVNWSKIEKFHLNFIFKLQFISNCYSNKILNLFKNKRKQHKHTHTHTTQTDTNDTNASQN